MPRKRVALVGLLLFAAVATTGCTHTQTVRLQPNTVEAGDRLRPIAAIQANAISFYALFIPIPGGADLDRVVNRMLVVTAKTMGADKIANLQFEATPDGGIWALRKLFWYRSARASGIAVQVTGPAPDPSADDGPEPVDDRPHSPPGGTGGTIAPDR